MSSQTPTPPQLASLTYHRVVLHVLHLRQIPRQLRRRFHILTTARNNHLGDPDRVQRVPHQSKQRPIITLHSRSIPQSVQLDGHLAHGPNVVLPVGAADSKDERVKRVHQGNVLERVALLQAEQLALVLAAVLARAVGFAGGKRREREITDFSFQGDHLDF